MPVRVGARQHCALPAELTSFVGRRADVSRVRRLLGTRRLVTLTGPGGCGKTRLALRVARALIRAYPDGLWLVDVGAVRDPELVAYTVATTLGLFERPSATPLDLIADHLRGRRCLLVLDNCDHVLDDCAALVGRLLAAAPALGVLCTSRQPLGMPGEYVDPVAPLAAPDPDRTGAGPLTAYPSVVLFLDRAAAAAPDFALTPANATTVAQICHRLDGLPLAVELAAAQLRNRSVEQVAAGLADRFRILASRHAVPAHHRTLQETVDWSHQLCAPREGALWRLLSVFVGWFDLDAATAVCAGEELTAADVVDAVAGLVDKSVLVRHDTPVGTHYRMLETVREYGRARLTEPDRVALQRRHLAWYARLSDRFDAGWFGPHQRRWLGRLRLSYANLRAALDTCLDDPEGVATAPRLAANLLWYWLAGGALSEGRHWLRRSLRGAAAPAAQRCRALAALTIVVSLAGDRECARSVAEEALHLARRVGTPALTAWCTAVGGLTGVLDHDLPRARRLLAEAREHYRGRDDTGPGAAVVARSWGMLLLFEGDTDGAERACAEGLAICRRRGDRWWQAHALLGAARVAMEGGRVTEGARYARDALRLAVSTGDALTTTIAIDRLGWTAIGAADYERACRLMGAADARWPAIGRPRFGARTWQDGATRARALARGALGARRFEAAVQSGRQLDLDQAVAYALSERATAPRTSADPLTAREREVARLIRCGLSNKAIARQLTISPRTADSHVANILRKLGFQSRAQVAAWVDAPAGRLPAP